MQSHSDFEFLVMKVMSWKIPYFFSGVIDEMISLVRGDLKDHYQRSLLFLYASKPRLMCQLITKTDRNSGEIALLLFSDLVKNSGWNNAQEIINASRFIALHGAETVRDKIHSLALSPGCDQAVSWL